MGSSPLGRIIVVVMLTTYHISIANKRELCGIDAGLSLMRFEQSLSC